MSLVEIINKEIKEEWGSNKKAFYFVTFTLFAPFVSGVINGFCFSKGMENPSEISLRLSGGIAAAYGAFGGILGTSKAIKKNLGFEYIDVDNERDYIPTNKVEMIKDIVIMGGGFAAAGAGAIALEHLIGAGIGYGIGCLAG